MHFGKVEIVAEASREDVDDDLNTARFSRASREPADDGQAHRASSTQFFSEDEISYFAAPKAPQFAQEHH